jgi:hypothetical protein
MRRWLERIGVDAGALALHDGSGLSQPRPRHPRFRPRACSRTWPAHLRPRSSATRCPRPDATVRSPGACAARRPRGVFSPRRLPHYVNALAGYATTAAGEPLAFAVICNDKTGARSNLSAFDSIVLQLTRHPGPDMP